MDPSIFKKLGFHEIDKKNLPMKIWNDCINCPKNIGEPGSADCPETALQLDI